MDWQEISGNWVLVPRNPVGVIHFLGGAFVATAPHLTYRWLLEQLADKGYVVIATPFVNTLDHSAIAKSVLLNFERALERLQDNSAIRKRYLPIYGIGHSMGCKLHLLIGSLFNVERAGNILISFNNYAARDAIPLIEQFNLAAVEFTPSPLETNKLVQDRYNVRRNLLIKFTNDTLDQSTALTELLKQRFPEMVIAQMLNGTHTTPLGQDIKWQTGESFTPFDALGQWFKQQAYRDLNQLKSIILFWLNPLSNPIIS
ncbi:MAG: DUF1350 family protein [Brasilonema octagenarum HA4186-MV1]|jgi:hypothetical protein|uniref:DUF1350 domain-containing protein n=2 Tax=Brasilonema TaxID=383614 RepID=A0A856MI36_9CYAN|nr:MULTISPECIES: DUF1350 family protein [Brasilonema]MBP5976346.1 DUF1350 family protein [Brasilonema sp. CT11]MBW4628014.1 DUF1350 family protein [Brasilonema octagenarum HA4186-MV1]QDL15155.1 hypothetical protein DP113_13595 [Brasilonema octagenarum UFV-E1]NMF62186.1 hypothetical protein [Brasilonema octagenarum UFV-OR1]QDL08797.1 hypothetical protein DP114_13650 [Brasilonema sennae CENA114]